MTEREQAIAELLYLKHDCLEGSATDQTLDKAIALLKAQEPVKPHVGFNPAGQPMWCCGNCGTTLFFKFHQMMDDEDKRNEQRFCHYCGQAVKWE